jgi:fumarate reductase subunit C
MNVQLYVWQRLTASVMAPLVLVHIAVIFYATHQGLTAADILSRTRGSIAWASYYGIFVAAASIHASIGVRNILNEWSPLRWRRSAFAPSPLWCCRDRAPIRASRQRLVDRRHGASAVRAWLGDFPAAAFLGARARHP